MEIDKLNKEYIFYCDGDINYIKQGRIQFSINTKDSEIVHRLAFLNYEGKISGVIIEDNGEIRAKT